jgi:hypothetical protein
MAVNVSAVITLKISRKMDTRIISEPIVLRQCFTITSSIRLGLVALFRILNIRTRQRGVGARCR